MTYNRYMIQTQIKLQIDRCMYLHNMHVQLQLDPFQIISGSYIYVYIYIYSSIDAYNMYVNGMCPLSFSITTIHVSIVYTG